jgi:tRNA 2-selenouridine synthase
VTWREIDIDQFSRLTNPLLIDVRSPCEHASEYIPGSINIPLLSDAERAVVGTLYVQQGEALARREALRLIVPKISQIVDDIRCRRASGQAIVIHCWRGGLRSEAVASFLSVVGIDCFRLTGGYKSFRRHLLEQLDGNRFSFTTVVLCGLTGVGKTDILKELSNLGAQVLDLESLANHRGSVFGSLGLGKQPTQKNFEAELFFRLKGLHTGYLFLEAESRKVGKLSLPDCIFNRIKSSKRILVTASLESRRTRILSEYSAQLAQQDPESAARYLGKLKERLGAKRCLELIEFARQSQFGQLVEILLAEYYDPLYGRHIERSYPYELEVMGDDPKVAAKIIHDWAIGERYSLAMTSQCDRGY